MMHDTDHELAGKTVKIEGSSQLAGQDYRIENWWDRVSGDGKSWMFSDDNPAALQYAMRSGMSGLPLDDEVVYGKIGGLGYIVHVSELGEVVEPATT